MSRHFPRGSVARLLLVCAAVALLSVSALAQSQATTGNIEGRVLDPAGASVPGTSVTATNQETGFERGATSDDDGLYRISLLPPGRYRVVAAPAGGFKRSRLRTCRSPSAARPRSTSR